MAETPVPPSRKRLRARQVWFIGLAFIAGFVLLGFLAIQGWEFSNSMAFCSDTCHAVHPEEPAAYQDSYHARVKCTECHMGRMGTIQGIFLKAGHFRHLPEVIFKQYERPLRSETMRPANESCEGCHWPPAFHGDRVDQITRFLPDETNTEKHIYLVLKTGGGERDRGLGYGIHWHIANQVEYIASDEGKQEIRWVRSTLPDGRVVEYNDVTNPLTSEEIANAEKRVMDCVDCHNRVGHPFAYPEQAIDQAMAQGQLDPALPYAKQQMMGLLAASYATQEEALTAAGKLADHYAASYPDVAAQNGPAIQQAVTVAGELLPRLVFEEPGVTWESFPDNGQHKEFAGCFRCHDGKHLSGAGESIRLHCNICHSVPVVSSADERAPQVPVANIQEPDSHLESNFIANHRFQASDEACSSCHGTVAFGMDDSSFCANSACHGRAWPAVELDAAFPHPIELEGQHAQVWCHDCHQGEQKPVYECRLCHEPPAQPHFGENCEQCHSPAGFDQADLSAFSHPAPLEGAHAEADCMGCHAEGAPAGFLCANCHEPPNAEHFQADCQNCHAPIGWQESAEKLAAAAPEIPHPTEGRETCLGCHDPADQMKPAPESHKAFANGQCVLCHEAES